MTRDHERAAHVAAVELAFQIDLDQLRRKLADPATEPHLLQRFADAVWAQQARALLARFIGADVPALHETFARSFVHTLRLRLDGGDGDGSDGGGGGA